MDLSCVAAKPRSRKGNGPSKGAVPGWFTLRCGGAAKQGWVDCLCRADQAPLNSGFLEMKTSTIPATQATEM